MDNELLNHNYEDNLDKLIEISRNNAISTNNLIQQVGNHTQQLGVINDALLDLATRMKEREENELVSPRQADVIKKHINGRVAKVLGLRKSDGKYTKESKAASVVYSPLFHTKLYRFLYDHFEVSSHKEIRATDFNKAIEMIDTWTPLNLEELKNDAEENWEIRHPGKSAKAYLGLLF